jgi:hypothetical protein
MLATTVTETRTRPTKRKAPEKACKPGYLPPSSFLKLVGDIERSWVDRIKRICNLERCNGLLQSRFNPYVREGASVPHIELGVRLEF